MRRKPVQPITDRALPREESGLLKLWRGLKLSLCPLLRFEGDDDRLAHGCQRA